MACVASLRQRWMLQNLFLYWWRLREMPRNLNHPIAILFLHFLKSDPPSLVESYRREVLGRPGLRPTRLKVAAPNSRVSPIAPFLWNRFARGQVVTDHLKGYYVNALLVAGPKASHFDSCYDFAGIPLSKSLGCCFWIVLYDPSSIISSNRISPIAFRILFSLRTALFRSLLASLSAACACLDSSTAPFNCDDRVS